MKPLTPVLAARARLRRFSTARKTAMDKCCQGALERPYQASLVRLTSSSAPAAVWRRARSGKMLSKQINTPTLVF